MSRIAALTPLRDLLVELYPKEESSRRLVADADIPHGDIAFQDAAVDNWHQILLAAHRRRRLGDLVEVVRRDAPQRQEELEAAYQQYLEAPEGEEEEGEYEGEAPEPPPSRRKLLLLAAAVLLLALGSYLYLQLGASQAAQRIQKMRVVRVVPGSTVLSLLPEADGPEPIQTYSLRLTAAGSPLAPPLTDVRQGVVYLGASREDLEAIRAREGRAEREESLARCLREFELENREEMMRHWSSHQLLATTEPILLEAGDLVVELAENPSAGNPEPAGVRSRLTISVAELSSGINTVCLQKVRR